MHGRENKVTDKYEPRYGRSWALIVGINDYPSSPLEHAVNDATAMAELLRTQFAFPEENITTLIDGAATSTGIREAFLRYAQDDVDPDDRLVVFFAGHGITQASIHGPVGFLMPHGADPSDISSMIRWDALTRDADFIRAKHIFFAMDACYSGLGITRTTLAKTRFVNDLITRRARQAIAAGKGDQTVVDSGGPREGNSLFTGHLLEALEGKAAESNGLILASHVMQYVYTAVGTASFSQQTPHFGLIDGDGDFLFNPDSISEPENESIGSDVLVTTPEDYELVERPERDSANLSTLIGDERLRIVLDKQFMDELRYVLEVFGSHFSVSDQPSVELVVERLQHYEDLTGKLLREIMLLAHWGDHWSHVVLLKKVISRLCDVKRIEGRHYPVLEALRWYPATLGIYAAGIGAVASGRYSNLREVFDAPVCDDSDRESDHVAIPYVMSRIAKAHDAFKLVPGHERHHVPRSEYMLQRIQPLADDALFMGDTYERVFDELEALIALSAIERGKHELGSGWMPPGRFVWKEQHRTNTPLSSIEATLERQGDGWEGLSLFIGGREEVEELVKDARKRAHERSLG
jgi:hypothetical protein